MDPIHLSDMVMSAGSFHLRDLIVWAGPFSALAVALLGVGVIHSPHSRLEPLPAQIVRQRQARHRSIQKPER